MIGAVIAQLIQLEQLRTTKDNTFDYWRYCLSTQIVQCLSVVTVCTPSIKNFLISIESGMIQTGHFQLRSTPILSDSSPSSSHGQPSLKVARRRNGTVNDFPELNEHSLISRNIAGVELGNDSTHLDGVNESGGG